MTGDAESFDDAENLLRSALAIYDADADIDAGTVLATRRAMGRMQLLKGDHKKAELTLRAVSKDAEEKLDKGHWLQQSILADIAEVLIEMGRIEDAELTLRAAKAAIGLVDGNTELAEGLTQILEAKLLNKSGGHDAAAIEFEKGLKKLKGRLGPDHPTTQRVIETGLDTLGDAVDQ